jgi:hypothetical protein
MKKLLFVLLFGAVVASQSFATNTVNVAPSATVGNDGLTCGTAKSYVYVNDPGNYSGTPTGIQIGPDTTVHLCNGTYNVTTNTTFIQFQGSGSSGHPITLLFDSGAIVQSPFFSFSGGFLINGLTDIVIDGGTNGILRNTANGSSLANQQPSAGIVAGCNRCELKNLTISNIYVSVAPNVIVDQTEVNAIQMSGSNWKVHNNTINDCGWCIRHFYNNGDANNQVYDNQISNFDHAYAYAAGSAVAGTGTFFHDNWVHDAANWDCGGGCHHDGIHVFGIAGNTIDDFNVYNNYFTGNWGASPTGFIFIEGGGSSAASHVINSSYYNNVGVVPPGATINTNGWFGIFSGSGNTQVYNNTIIGGAATDNEACFNIGSVHNFTFKNNVVERCGNPVQFGFLTGTNNINNNFYGTSCQNSNNCFVWNNGFTGNFTNWKATCACDSASTQTNSILLNTDGSPQVGSPIINAGPNLTSTATGSLAALQFDTSKGNTRAPTARPTTGNWTEGAYNFASSTPALCASPNPVGFGSSTVGVTSGTSPITVTITSCGSVSATLSALPLTAMNGTNPGDFQQIGGGTNPCTASEVLAPAATCNLRVQFTPGALGARTATMRVQGTATVDVVLNGTGTAVGTTIITATPSSNNFGNVAQHAGSGLFTTTIANTGTLPVTLSTPVTSFATAFPGDFAVVSIGGECNSGQTLNPGNTCVKQFQATPSTVGVETATATIGTTGTASASIAFTVTGTSLASSINITPRPVQFPSQTVLVPGAAVVATVTNTGAVSVTLAAANAVTVTGTLAANFVKQGTSTCNNNTVLAASATCHADYIWTPGATPTTEVVTLTVTTTLAITNSVTMQGTSVAVVPQPVTNPLMLSFKFTGNRTLTMTMNGVNFVPGKTTATWDNRVLPTTCVSSVLCTATLPASSVYLPSSSLVGHLIGVK